MILFKRTSQYAVVPTYATDGAVGMDLYAALPQGAYLDVPAGEHKLIPLGFSAEIPEDHWVQLAARSGLAVKHGIMVMAGIIDPDYRGDWAVILYNSSKIGFRINAGERVAQAIVHFRSPMRFVETEEELSYTDRGAGGFGSTGLK
jgi:dUTP pyrophosphatase